MPRAITKQGNDYICLDQIIARLQSTYCAMSFLLASPTSQLLPPDKPDSINRRYLLSRSAESAFEQFPEGLPCEAKLLPTDLRELQQVADRRAEREVRYCKVTSHRVATAQTKQWPIPMDL